ncbi:TetR/AcrR family transcriptional regulator [Paenibacillus sp. N3.4]|uniref:TetR/AcrR family transcriptional regulator n=1 Tax=Paenibacillus sp. N3.4 TaxID=2603222 RepID=UPI0011C8B645|nr:TetR/AcrR family transcriptional regulator [Paenibacillus sp. N3.4]TXK86003.1 TetR/AcrR family transcriptional regulator [Paenibacillus sp. N3.4]
MILAAQELFLEKDLSGVTMKDIGQRLGISRVTLYKYYNSIDELAFEVQMKVLEDLFGFIEAQKRSGSAIEKMRNLFLAWEDFTKRSPSHLRFIGLFDHYYLEKYPTRELEEKYKEFIKNVFPSQVLLIREGIQDGSIRSDLDPAKTSAMLANTMMSMTQRMASRGNILRVEQEIDPGDMIFQLIDMIMAYLKSEAPSI